MSTSEKQLRELNEKKIQWLNDREAKQICKILTEMGFGVDGAYLHGVFSEMHLEKDELHINYDGLIKIDMKLLGKYAMMQSSFGKIIRELKGVF